MSEDPSNLPEQTEIPGVEPAGAPPEPQESEASFVLRVFGVNPKNFIGADGRLNRVGLAVSVTKYRNLYAQRVLGGFTA